MLTPAWGAGVQDVPGCRTCRTPRHHMPKPRHHVPPNREKKKEQEAALLLLHLPVKTAGVMVQVLGTWISSVASAPA
jgi:hypothetical protein